MTDRRLFLTGLIALWIPCAFAREALNPGPEDTCPVCGMLVAKYPNWVAVVRWKDGHRHFFDGAKDMFKFLGNLPKYAPGHRREDIAALYVTDFYNLERIDAHQALYVIGSDVLGPMGHEPIPLASRADADEFMTDHKGKHCLGFKEISPEILILLDGKEV